jgi:hypothetical protein
MEGEVKAMKREGLWGFGALLVALCVGGCGGEGDGGGGGSVLILEDEPDMPVSGGPGGPGGVDLGGMMSEMGGMMGGDVDPLFLRWIRSRLKLAEYDCTCSQGSAWSPVWNQEACAQGWERYIGGEETLNCQYSNIFSDEYNKARFKEYVDCFESNDARFYQCIGADVCTNDGGLVYSCLNSWNDGRNSCIFKGVDVHSVMESCRSELDGINPEYLTYVDWTTTFSSDPSIISPIGLDWPHFDRFDDRCGSSYACNIMQIKFRSNGLYSSFVMSGVLGNIYASIDQYHESGEWGVRGGRLLFSPDCKSAYVQRSGAMLFQRVFFGNIAIERARGINSEAVDLQADISREYACQDEGS